MSQLKPFSIFSSYFESIHEAKFREKSEKFCIFASERNAKIVYSWNIFAKRFSFSLQTLYSTHLKPIIRYSYLEPPWTYLLLTCELIFKLWNLGCTWIDSLKNDRIVFRFGLDVKHKYYTFAWGKIISVFFHLTNR